MTSRIDDERYDDDGRELTQVARRLENIERLVETVEHVADKGVESWNEYLKQKSSGEEHARKLEDLQHRRVCWVLSYACALVFGLAGFSLWKDQYELVRLILSSSLAVAAGAGLTAVLRGSRKPPSK